MTNNKNGILFYLRSTVLFIDKHLLIGPEGPIDQIDQKGYQRPN